MQDQWRSRGRLLPTTAVLCLRAKESDDAVPRRPLMRLALTAVFKKVSSGYVGFVEELPGANTQGATLEEARANLREAAQLVLEANRTVLEAELGGGDIVRERLEITAA